MKNDFYPSENWVPTIQSFNNDGQWTAPDPDSLPPERKVVLVWIKDEGLPRLAYVRYSAGDKNSPYWVVYTARADYHDGDQNQASNVIAYLDCIPQTKPSFI